MWTNIYATNWCKSIRYTCTKFTVRVHKKQINTIKENQCEFKHLLTPSSLKIPNFIGFFYTHGWSSALDNKHVVIWKWHLNFGHFWPSAVGTSSFPVEIHTLLNWWMWLTADSLGSVDFNKQSHVADLCRDKNSKHAMALQMLPWLQVLHMLWFNYFAPFWLIYRTFKLGSLLYNFV